MMVMVLLRLKLLLLWLYNVVGATGVVGGASVVVVRVSFLS